MADFIKTVVDFLNRNLAAELGASASTPKVFADAAPQVNLPYIVMHDPDEVFSRHSTGELVSSGHLQLNIKAAAKAQARSIALAAIWKVMAADAAGSIAFDEGVLDEIVPSSAHSAPLVEIAPSPSAPTAAERTVILHYRIRYTPPS